MQNPTPRYLFSQLGRMFNLFFFSCFVLLTLAALYVSQAGPLLGTEAAAEPIWKTLAITLAVLNIPLAYGLAQKQIKSIPKQNELTEKIRAYRSPLLLRFSLAHAAFSANCILFLLSGDQGLMIIMAIVLLFFILSRPSPFRAALDLELSDEEKTQII